MFIGYDNALYARYNHWIVKLALKVPFRWLYITQARVGEDYHNWVRISLRSNLPIL